MLFEADYAKNYAGIMYQCLHTSRKILMPLRVCPGGVVHDQDTYM